MKFSELIGKKVICMSFAKEIGMVFNCTVDKKLKKVNQIIAVDKEEDEGYVDFKKVIIGNDVLFTTNSLADYTANGVPFPFRTPVYNTDGTLIGKIIDFEITGNAIDSLYLSNDLSLPSSEVVVASDEMVVVKGRRKIRIKQTSPKSKLSSIEESFNNVEYNSVDKDTKAKKETTKNEPVVATIKMENSEQIVTPTITQNNEKEDNNPALRKLIAGYKFLLGRKVIKHIIAGGKMLIPRGKLIDVETVELARKYGKLVELTVSSVGEME